MVEQMGADFVDLNFGCPVPKVVNKGAGSACLKDLGRLGETIRATKSGVTIPVTIKVRTGWDAHTRNSPDVAHVAFNEGATWMAIHGRTRAAAYTGLADWDYIRDVKAQSPLPILGNGDITSSELAGTRLAQSGCDGVMIGRGCLKKSAYLPRSFARNPTARRIAARFAPAAGAPRRFLRGAHGLVADAQICVVVFDGIPRSRAVS